MNLTLWGQRVPATDKALCWGCNKEYLMRKMYADLDSTNTYCQTCTSKLQNGEQIETPLQRIARQGEESRKTRRF